MHNLTGGSGNDTFTLSGGTLAGNINGGGGTNTIAGDNVSNTWNLTGTNGGTVTGLTGQFSNIQNLVGGNSNNHFVFANGATVTGLVNGGSLTNTNTIDYSNYIAPVNITLSTISAGSASNNDTQALVNTFSNINQLVGNYSSGVINIGTNPFTVTYTGNMQGYISDPIFFFGYTVTNNPPPSPPPPPPPQSSSNPNVASIVQQPVINNADSSSTSSSSSSSINTPQWVVTSDLTTANMTTLIQQLSVDYANSLNKIVINPTCFAVH